MDAEEEGVEALMSLSQSQLPVHTAPALHPIRHMFFDSSDEDSDYDLTDDECVEVGFKTFIPRNREKNVASAQVQAFVIKYIEEWNETPNDTNLQLYMDTIYRRASHDLSELVVTHMNIPIECLDHERQVAYAVAETEYKPPSPKKLCEKTLKKFRRSVKTIYCPPASEKKKEKQDEDICVICMESVESGKRKKVQIKNCKHKFHQACLQKWVSCDWCCPTCKQPL